MKFDFPDAFGPMRTVQRLQVEEIHPRGIRQQSGHAQALDELHRRYPQSLSNNRRHQATKFENLFSRATLERAMAYKPILMDVVAEHEVTERRERKTIPNTRRQTRTKKAFFATGSAKTVPWRTYGILAESSGEPRRLRRPVQKNGSVRNCL